MTDPIDLTLRAAGLWFRAATLPLRTAADISTRLAGTALERLSPPETEREDAESVTPARTPAARTRPTPSPKERRRRARGEPTRGQAARRRSALRAAAAPPAGETAPGAEVQVDEPWEGYAAMPVPDVLARLDGADPITRAAVRLYEQRNEAREAVLHAAKE
jgi:hypothetical protein